MTQLFLNPLTKFTSDNITALPGARLYFYQNNSSTPKAVYADKNKATSLGVYVEADSAGIFEPIWLDGTYRAELKYSPNWNTTPGVTQTGWPVDDVGDIGNFAAFAAWDSTFTYDITTNTFVTGPDGNYYQSIQNPNLNKTPASNPDYWKKIFIIGEWNDSIDYSVNEIVYYAGKLYVSSASPNLNNEPPNLSFWADLTFNNNIPGSLTVEDDITSTAGDVVARNITKMARKNSSTARTSTTTETADPDLVLTGLTTGWIYAVEGQIRWNDAGGGAGNGIKLTLDDGVNNAIFSCIFSQTDSVTTPVAKDGSVSASFTAGLAGSDSYITFNAMVRLESGATSISLKWAQATSSATSTTVEAGYIKVTGVPN